jgi:sugar lactone lactonase YvrE
MNFSVLSLRRSHSTIFLSRLWSQSYTASFLMATVAWAILSAAPALAPAQAWSGVQTPFRVSDPGSTRNAGTTIPGAFTRVHRQVSARPNGSSPQTATPDLSLAAGAYSSAQTVAITDATNGATIYYTTDGTIPSTSSPVYSGPVTISTSLTIAAFAAAPGYSTSDWVLATYFIGSAPDSFMYTIAGTDFWGFEGDGGPATQALLNIPQGTAVDKSGNVYISDTRNQIIRKIDASTRLISTIAGTGVAGLSGDGGPAIDAQLNWPTSVAFDSTGNLYVSESSNNDIRKIDLATGVITTYASSVFSPYGIAFDSNDNLYVVANNRVFEIDAKTQTVTPVAGSGQWGTLGDGGPALQASMSLPQDVAVDKSGNLYIADTLNGAVRFVNRNTGLITTVAGKLGSSFGYSGDGGPARNAQFSLINSVTLDPNGDLWIGDEYNWRIRKVTLATGIVNTVVGNGQACFSTGDDGSPATFAAVCEPNGLRFDKAGNLYYADLGPSRIKKVTAAAPPPTTYTATPQFGLATGTYVDPQNVPITDATPGASVYLSFGGSAASTPLTESQSYHGGLEVDGDMTISAIAVAPGHLPSAVSSATYKITAPPTSIISTVAGSGSYGFTGAGGPATSAQLGAYQLSPAIDAAGNIFIADEGNSVVWKVDSGTGTINVYAGTGKTGYTGDGGPATSATLNQPYSIALDSAGNLYIADSRNNVVREVFAADGTIKTVAGDGLLSGLFGDGGPATAAQINFPKGIAVDKNSNLYIADTDDCRVRKVTASTGIIETVAGNGTCGQSPDGTPATAGPIGNVTVVAVQAGDIYFSENSEGRIRKVGASHILSTVAGNGNYGTCICARFPWEHLSRWAWRNPQG